MKPEGCCLYPVMPRRTISATERLLQRYDTIVRADDRAGGASRAASRARPSSSLSCPASLRETNCPKRESIALAY